MLKDASHLTSPQHVSVGLVPGFWPAGSHVRVVFCHVMGTEESPQDYTGPEGREESKYNLQEVQAVVSVVCLHCQQWLKRNNNNINVWLCRWPFTQIG